ncbi:MAG: N-acetylglutaminylglutamine amidotransferase [Bradyrhizobium sp.]
MCGICGEISFKGAPDHLALSKMALSLRKRGPDAGGFFIQQGLAFGHRRLSILDLSPNSQQPMIDSELGLGIVFNGCIYNFRELRRELQDRGYRFFSDGDTEVILKSYHAWGPRCVERFKGMFAFALWERATGRVILVRDRLGIKPLYYTDTPESFRFASSLPALLEAGSVDTALDPIGLHHYFSFHAAVPPPRTILKGVKKLAPASILTIEPDGSRRNEIFWSLNVGEREEDRKLTEQEWTDAVAHAMSEAVERRRVSDVPVGILLSGGLDSSLVVALLARQGQKHILTFSVGFDRVDQHEGDEFKYSDIVAKAFSTTHHQIRVDANRSLTALPDAIGAMSEPMVSHDAIGFYLLSEEVSKHVSVVQSGQGADEVFGGYHWYPPFLKSNDPLDDYARLYFDWSHAEISQLLEPQYVSADHSRDFVASFFANTPATAPIDKVLQLDTEVMLVDDPVKRVDNMTMAWGLEARVPFLDHDVVELAARIPARLKVKDGGKYILKQAARKFIPAEIIDRPKGYFPVPALRYLRGPFLELVREVLNQSAAKSRGLFQRSYVERMLAQPEQALSPKGHSRLWQAALLESWMQAHAI